jgi:IAA-amino acid hydrolase
MTVTPTLIDSAETIPAIPAGGLLEEARSIRDWITDIRRTLHMYPEVLYEEVRTGEVVRHVLDQLGIRSTFPVAKTGIVATVGTGASPCVALRADMDALPIHEEVELEFRSRIPGRMHACGHDCHTAMLLGAARLLKRRESSLRGTVKLIFQPAEEGGAGGKLMCDEGALSNPPVDRIFGLHVWPYLPTGMIGSRAGALMAAAGIVDITVVGKGGHAAFPHMAIDPVAAAAKIVTELQTIVAREVDPLEAAVLTIASIHGGEAFNVIPSEVRMMGTIRSLTLEGLQFLQQRVREIATQVAAANRCEAVVSFPGNDYPPTVNDAGCWDDVRSLGVAMLGDSAVVELAPVMGGEDFAYYGAHARACFVALGTRNESIGATFSVHHPRFMVDEDALPIGSALHAAYALRFVDEGCSRRELPR